ncbi:hypothetical protein R3P38DRAFT_1120385 [Favolaschia claudopus]|uniref:GATA-type domain-containing protein n=1 Tax=Favolaschia claudopus TaxID=2862362 RepID=A0AAW0B8W7_9AGAR
MRFLDSLREEGIELYAFIDSLILHGHLDNHNLRLREVLEYRLGKQLRMRDSPVAAASRDSVENPPSRQARKCSSCGIHKTSQWRRHPYTKISLCNPCGQKAYQAFRR